MSTFLRPLAIVLMLAAVAVSSGCAKRGPLDTTVRVIATPVCVARDVVDVPLVSLTNAFNIWAEKSNRDPTPRAGVGWTLRGGINPYAGWDLSYVTFKVISGFFGGIDYVVCRSIYPNFPKGVSPWLRSGESWWSMYFPNTRALWRAKDYRKSESEFYEQPSEANSSLQTVLQFPARGTPR